MKKFRSFLLWLCVIVCILPAHAERVNVEKAGKVAASYARLTPKLSRQRDFRLSRTFSKKIQRNHPAGLRNAAQQDEPMYYVFTPSNNQGFIIISGDDVAVPVLGYAEEGVFDESNLNFKYWMDCLSEEIAEAIENDVQQDAETKVLWDAYINEQLVSLRSKASVSPLVQTRWNQTAPYNNSCPPGTVTGCVATAMAQIMKFHNWPTTRTVEIPGYTTSSEKIVIPTITGSTIYDWSNMPNLTLEYTTETKKIAVATLMYHCGVSVNMDYGPSSGAVTSYAGSSLVTYFGYDKSVQNKQRLYYTDDAWETLLKNELSEGRPVLYAGHNPSDGHAFVCDGYNGTGLFHFNWGWGGYQDGYFVTTALNPGSGGAGSGAGTYNLNQEILINIKPDPAGTSIPVPDITIWPQTSITSSETSVDIGQAFSVNAPVCNGGLFPFSGEVGIALVNNSDNIVAVISQRSINLDPGYGYSSPFNFTCVVPTSVAAGNYRLKVIARSSGTNEWMFVSASSGYTDVLDLTVNAAILPSLPYVANVTPNNGAIGIPVSGQLVITFDKVMNTADGIGAVSLGGGIVGNVYRSCWSGGNKTVTIPYSGLDYNTTYTFNISGFQDASGNVMEAITSGYSFTTTFTDVASPTPGNSGAIGTASIAAQTLRLNWTKATDNVSAKSALKYYVYQSASANIGTVAACGTNGTLLNSGGTTDMATYAVTGLSPNTTYYFNVVVEDEAGNKAVYTTTSATTNQVYGVSIATFTGGTVAPDKADYEAGQTVTLTIVPDAGYMLNTLAVYKTGEQATTIAFNGSGNTRTFTMPAYGVTVTATFRNPDMEAVNTAKGLVEGMPTPVTVTQTDAPNATALKTWLATQINALSGMSATGITVTAANINLSNFTAATAGSAGTPSGTNGRFSFTVNLSKGASATVTTASKSGTITATPYVAPSTYIVALETMTNGTLTVSPQGSLAAGTFVTLTIAPATGYELATISAYRTDTRETAVALTGSGNTRTFTMPAYGVTVTATFKKTQAQLDEEAVAAAKAAVEGGTYQIAQATANEGTSVTTWLVNTLNVLFGQSHEVQFRSATFATGDVTVTTLTPAVEGTESNPSGVNGSFGFTVHLVKGTSVVTATVTNGVILAIPHAVTSTGIAPQVQMLKAFIINGILHVSGLVPNELLSIYNMQGKLFHQEKVTETEKRIYLRERGIYVVASGGRTVKVVL
ncbi:MAG: C10 family peptidase [Tannerellaceae bacterium]|jgi:hypothetical protein|nr:C10 family peptidase [Tannerellaceae bacterium]